MEYRRLTKDDAKNYRELRLLALQTNPDAFLTEWHEANERPLSATLRDFDNPQAVTFGALESDRLVGVMTLLRMAPNKTRHRAEVLAVYTHEDMRGKRIASGLLDHLLAHSKKIEGLVQLELAVNSENLPAIRLYERFGFEHTGTARNAVKTGERYIDELLMMRTID